MKDLKFLAELAKEAGKAILEVYGTEFSVERKEDRSPLTEADTRSHQIITRALESDTRRFRFYPKKAGR